MSLGKISMHWSLIVLFCVRISRACKAPRGTNFTQPPRYWCDMETQVSIGNTCDNEVEEKITVPWLTGGMVNRFIPTGENENIDDLSAFRILNGKRIPAYSGIRRDLSPGNVIASVRVGSTKRPVTLVLKYRKIGVVQRFSKCAGMGDFVNVNSSLENTLMMSKWAVGGRSISRVERVKVIFILPRHEDIQYVDTVTTVPAVFKQETESQTNDLDKPVRVTYNGLTSEERPSKLFFFVRFFVRLGLHSCPFSRNCEAENLTFKESNVTKVNPKIIVGLVLGLGFSLFLICVVLVCCCKRIRTNSRMETPEADGEEQVPASLIHFIHDTGDDSETALTAQTLTASTADNEEKEEFYA